MVGFDLAQETKKLIESKDFSAVSIMQNQDQMMGLYEKLLVKYLNYSTMIEGVAALCTIPIMAVMFHKDRVKEKIRGVIPNKKAPLWRSFFIRNQVSKRRTLHIRDCQLLSEYQRILSPAKAPNGLSS